MPSKTCSPLFPLLLAIVAGSQAAAQTPFAFRDTGRETGLLPVAEGIMGHGAGWGDIDGDGWPDLYIGTFHYPNSQPNLLLHNRGGKRFELDSQTAPRISARATGVVFADLDNDGDLDLYVGSMPADADSRLAQRNGHAFSGCAMFQNDGQGEFTDISADNGACPAAFGGRSVAVLDFDGDGRLDLLVGEDPIPGYNGSKTRSSRLFRNLGGLKFADVSRAAGLPDGMAGLGVAAADLNRDTWPDLVVASSRGNHVLLNDGQGQFRELAEARETLAWPTAGGDDMVCGVAIADVDQNGWPDLVLGQHFSTPWVEPVFNRLYLHQGLVAGVPQWKDATEAAGLTALPMKSPHVEIQDFDNDGRPDIYFSQVLFEPRKNADASEDGGFGAPHPVIFQNAGVEQGVPRFRQSALQVNDFPTAADRAIRRSGAFFEKMIAENKIIYSAPGPTADYDRDGRLDLFLPNWWAERPSLLLHNETPGGNWLEVQLEGRGAVNRMGVGAAVAIYHAGRGGEEAGRIGAREIAVGFGYASGQEAVAHFGLGAAAECDIIVTLPHGRGVIRRNGVAAGQRLMIPALADGAN